MQVCPFTFVGSAGMIRPVSPVYNDELNGLVRLPLCVSCMGNGGKVSSYHCERVIKLN